MKKPQNLNEFISDFGIELNIEHKRIGKFLCNTDISESESLFFAGESIATIGKTIIPSPKLLELIREKTKSYIVLNEKASWLFICGRDILSMGIEKKGELTKKSIVLNKRHEILGVSDKNRNLLENYWNIGDYLKREN